MDGRELDRRIERAMEMHERNFNCAQCVGLACADLVELDEESAFRMLEGFGGGMGDHTQTCGAISGGIAVIAYAMSGGMANPTTKQATYVQASRLSEYFRTQIGSTVCADIKGETGGAVLRSCEGCVADGIRMTVEILEDL